MGNKVTALSSEIDISGKQLIDLPTEKEVKDFVRLKSVNLNQNEFRRIPLIISAGLGTKPAICETLTSLDFSKNRLKALPEEFCNLVNLVRLKLDHNDLAELPLMFSALYKLEKLTLNFNRLKMLPPNIGALRGLKVLRLDHNKLSWIPNDVGELSHIRELTIHDNPLGVDLLEFSDLDSVLAYFRLQPVPSEYRKSLRALKKLMGDAPKTEGDAIKDSKIHVFKALLADNRGRASFMKYLEKEVAAENLKFYVEVESFKKKYSSATEITTNELIDEASVIYSSYVDPKSHQPVNLPDDVAKKIVAIWQDSFKFPAGVNQWIFNDAQLSILKLMYTDSLKRYVKTDEGKGLWSAFEASEGK